MPTVLLSWRSLSFIQNPGMSGPLHEASELSIYSEQNSKPRSPVQTAQEQKLCPQRISPPRRRRPCEETGALQSRGFRGDVLWVCGSGCRATGFRALWGLTVTRDPQVQGPQGFGINLHILLASIGFAHVSYATSRTAVDHTSSGDNGNPG